MGIKRRIIQRFKERKSNYWVTHAEYNGLVKEVMFGEMETKTTSWRRRRRCKWMV